MKIKRNYYLRQLVLKKTVGVLNTSFYKTKLEIWDIKINEYMVELVYKIYQEIFMKKKIIAFISLFFALSAFLFAKDLKGVKVGFSDTQLQISTEQSLSNVRIRVNSDYIYEVSSLPAGIYTVGLATFADKKGNRFNPFSKKIRSVSIFSSQGSTYFTCN